MSRLHLCNTFFERELERGGRNALELFSSHPTFLQLQFLPLLYAGPEDRIAVTALPPNPDPRLVILETLDLFEEKEIESWGPSRTFATYTDEEWEEIRRINSKETSFSLGLKLPGAALIETESELLAWERSFEGPKVAKSFFGVAGQGHFHLERRRPSLFPVIGEPWVERLFDFSTQWKRGKLLGATVCKNGARGQYEGSIAGPEEKIFHGWEWALKEHLAYVTPVVEQLPYRGNLGVDAYVYRWKGEVRLQPLVEINGRKTMGWLAWELYKKGGRKEEVKLGYASSQSEGLLPISLKQGGKEICFSRQLVRGGEAVGAFPKTVRGPEKTG